MRTKILFAVVLAALLVFPAGAFAATWDLATDYAARWDSTQPLVKDAAGNSVWYFKVGDTATDPGTFTATPLSWTTSFSWMAAPPVPGQLKGWVRSPGGLPHVSVNTGVDVVSSTTPPFTWKASKVLSHPMPASDTYTYSVIEWKSPVAGAADASIALTDVDSGGTTGFEYWVLKGTTQLAHGTPADGAAGTEVLTDINVAAGESIYVVLGPGPDGSHSWDSTQIDIIITVPDPPVVSTPASSEWTLAILGLLGIAVLGSRKLATLRS